MRGSTSERQSSVSLLENGDEIEKRTWPKLKHYLSKYETLWRMHVEPLRIRGSIHLRDGIDEDFEVFAMNHYTTYLSLSRAFDKIEERLDDFTFAEEIWANLQRATEVARKAAIAFAKLYEECTRKPSQLNIAKLDQVESDIKLYRNLLHGPMIGTVKDGNGVRLIPRREVVEKYVLWSRAMYHGDESDFVPVDTQLAEDFNRVCSVLQDLWKQIETASERLVTTRDYLRRRSAGKVGTIRLSVSNQLAASGTANICFRPQGPERN
jgi:MFS superfamily sulfate permease-like transporter